MASTRVPPFPTAPLLVFSGVGSLGGWRRNEYTALAQAQVQSVMSSFSYIQRSPKVHDELAALVDGWPTRRYLDSGMFTLMQQWGPNPTKTTGVYATPIGALNALTDAYTVYLDRHLDLWDHVADLDCDAIPALGPDLAANLRYELHRRYGDKLLPVWHAEAGMPAWERMCEEYPYVALGSSLSGLGQGPTMGAPHVVRAMVNLAHRRGALVHLMGSASVTALQATGADTGDSTRWKAGLMHANFGGQRYSSRARLDPSQRARARSFAAHVEETYGVNPNDLLTSAGTEEKLRLSIAIQQAAEASLQLARAVGTTLPPSVTTLEEI